MKRNIIVFILLAISVFLICIVARAENYIITILGGGEVIVIEHDGEIAAFGCGAKGGFKSDGRASVDGFDPNSGIILEYDDRQYTLNKAQDFEENNDWFMATIMYRNIGETELMKEMASKDIDYELAKDPPNYRGAYVTANDILNDVEAAEYYKGLWEEQEANDQ